MSKFFTLDPGDNDASLTDKILFKSASEFSIFITEAAHKNKDTVTQTILAYCADRDVDPTDIAKLVSKPLKELIEIEMQEIGLLKKKSTASFE